MDETHEEGNLVKLPGIDRAVVSASETRDSLLSDSHPIGKFKAAFFTSLGDSAAG